jgi:aminopeptidase-like protein
MMDLLAYCDGRHDLIAIGDKIHAPVWELAPISRRLAEHGLLK